ncbi:hypothetical protein EYF80_055158 [Liparis tanakae]|uniref:Uncharacterized protein n=1 Tax=Liparis tanakae TaxID=230148 RepID=A0A4Z2F2F7_9TELE|nr:hypothetical protein EYF80_055158 [Liparis tanakae]
MISSPALGIRRGYAGSSHSRWSHLKPSSESCSLLIPPSRIPLKGTDALKVLEGALVTELLTTMEKDLSVESGVKRSRGQEVNVVNVTIPKRAQRYAVMSQDLEPESQGAAAAAEQQGGGSPWR